MNISVKKIQGNEYLYLSENLYISKGKTRLKNKSLGRVGPGLEARKREVENFQKQIVAEEALERIRYWGRKTDYSKAYPRGLIKDLEMMRGELYRKKNSLGIFGREGLEAAFKTDFIYNSNKLEGSKLPKKTIEDYIRKGGRKSKEIAGSLLAIDFVRDKKVIDSTEKLVELHKKLLAHEPDNHGIRKEPVVVWNSETLEHQKIPEALKNLFRWYKENNHKIYPPELAFLFYYKFERIHPFKDGNGRVGRLLMNAVLKEHRYHPIIVWNSQRSAHMNGFEEAMKGQVHKFLRFMASQMKTTYQTYLLKLNKAEEIEKSIEETFFTPSR